MGDQHRPAAADKPLAWIRLRRTDAGPRDRLRAYKVLVDGHQIGVVHPGQTLDFPVAPGHHRLQLKLGRCGSPELTVRFGRFPYAPFVCGPDPRPWTLSDLATPRRYSSYIYLARDNGALMMNYEDARLAEYRPTRA